jgi:hypothetical protein
MSKKPAETPKGKAPAHLKPATQRWFAAVLDEFELEEHHVKLLTLAAESWDRRVAARTALDTLGLTFTDRFGAPHARPEIAIERDSRIAFARIVRELDLDVAPSAAPTRPPTLRSNRK